MFDLSHLFRRLAIFIFLFGLTALFSLTLLMPNPVNAQTAPGIGTATSFAVLGGSAITNTGPSTINGDLGISPGNSITGFPPGVVNGTQHPADAVALQAQSDVTTAYNNLAGQSPCTDLTGQDLGGLTLIQGIYCFSTAAQLTGVLTLDAQGNSAAVFIFQIGSTLTTASNSSVTTINGGTGCNIWWQVGSSATLGTTTAFEGNILALTSITLNTTATILPGRALARNGAVTLDTNTIDMTACVIPPTATPTATATATETAIPSNAPASSNATSAPAATFPPIPTFTLSPPITIDGKVQGVSGLPNTGGGRPQPTYWLSQNGP